MSTGEKSGSKACKHMMDTKIYAAHNLVTDLHQPIVVEWSSFYPCSDICKPFVMTLYKFNSYTSHAPLIVFCMTLYIICLVGMYIPVTCYIQLDEIIKEMISINYLYCNNKLAWHMIHYYANMATCTCIKACSYCIN